MLTARSDLLKTTSPSALTFAGLDGWRRQMVEHGRAALAATLRLAAQVRGELGRAGYQASEWPRTHCQVDLGLSDHRRMAAH
ncbi:hypothetical protein [Actinophytocola sp.]|uniref:hypothetical protein n=1 Tax=Actinophytocola sp. TaxID=1872138 RepID=UPI002D803FE4|nr:hypothetical protein [Actinophytocola sp.]HET9137940.1 hypothetical protein [Actinophytocola sp.]